MKRLQDILKNIVPESIYNHAMIDLEITREEFSWTLHKWSDLQLQDAKIKENQNSDKGSLIEILEKVGKIKLNTKHKYGGCLTAYKAMELSNKYKEALKFIYYSQTQS